MTDTTARVSAYVPCYNAERYLASTLDALLTQTHGIDEIVVVDDGSTDSTVQIARRFPVRLIQHGVNKGLAAARNTGVQSAKHELVASVDADVVLTPRWLERILEAFTDPNVAGAGGRCIESFQNAAADRWRALHLVQDLGENDVVITPELDLGLSGFASVFRKSALLRVGGYDETFRTNWEDWDISRRLRAAGYTLIYSSQALAHHMRRDTPSSVVRTAWRWVFWIRYHEGVYDRLVPKLLHNLLRASSKAWHHVQIGDLALLAIDCRYLVCFCWWDLLYFLAGRQATGRIPDRVELWHTESRHP